MAEKENAAPSSTGPTSAQPSGADQPGRPYYESLRATLRQTLEKKRKLDDALAAVEENIYKLEGAYLEETAGSGNIVRGFDGWVKGVVIGDKKVGGAGRGRIREEERVFSRSSVRAQLQEGVESGGTSSGVGTPREGRGSEGVAGTGPVGSGNGKVTGGNKKRRVGGGEEEEEGKVVKRSKISYARD
ncbi:NuA4-domain-containing protein [Teratosphaeria destructans]|uniref:Chromatin modification-related protein EAF6 n=1 Tax=Teratosphaeria destructans TaxID=418781 RepID=A0A9W7SJE5_9PEZI|nr:NuA4-domain-containing protein [Teratosphaeria destructans]